MGDEIKIRQSVTLGSSKVEDNEASSDSESEDELPSPSKFIRRKPDLKSLQDLPEVEDRVPKVADAILNTPHAAPRPLSYRHHISP